MSEPTRLDLLRSYFDRLRHDMARAGKFAAHGENKIEATVKAVLTGGSAMAVQFAADVKALGGEGAAMAAPLAEALVANAAADGAKAAMGWAGSQLKELFNGKARAKTAQQRAGKAIMDAAAKMGGRK